MNNMASNHVINNTCKRNIESLRQKLILHKQQHLLDHWNDLTDKEQEQLYHDLEQIDYERVKKYFSRCSESMTTSVKVDEFIEPVPRDICGSIVRTDQDTLKAYEAEGLRLISEGKVAVLLLAGGQGTRLGVAYPKGMYQCGLPSGKTLYQLQAERLLRMQEMARESYGRECVIAWYIMTSEHTKQPTLDFFSRYNYFGLEQENVILFEQNQLPCLSFDGKIIMQSRYKVARAPDGNGGLYRALGDSSVMQDLEKRGFEHVHVYCVDNILVKMADPVFIGFSALRGADCSAKAVEKAFPTEPVGVVCRVNGLYQVVEYSEISLSTAEQRNPDGRLTFNAGNICNHYLTVEFLKMIVLTSEDRLKHHVAKKKIPFVDTKGNTVKPEKPNGIKMEKFVFDVFQFAKNFAVWEVLREDEFSPLKNADGADKDTPTTTRHSVFDLHRRWVRRAGGHFISEDGSLIADIPSQTGNEPQNDPVFCEISPLISYNGEDLSSVVSNKKFIPPLEIYRNSKGRTVVRSATLH